MISPSRRALLTGLSSFGFASPLAAQNLHTPKDSRFKISDAGFQFDGKPLTVCSGEIHPHRVPVDYWSHRLKMLRAIGLNAVSIYVFWNNIEWQEGHFDWTGSNDIAAFIRLAQEEGLLVILRPGPYVCGEWDLGGLPWWLLKNGADLRTCDPKFLKPAELYLREVGRQLAPLTLSRGGPIAMVQVENEYGSFGHDTAYIQALRDIFISAGFDDIPLYCCNPRIYIGNGYLPDLFQVANFGPGIWPKGIPALRQYQKTGPLMVGEYYPAWVDAWGKPHNVGEVAPFLKDLEKFVKEDISFNIYMAHGGTNFGLLAGGGAPFEPFVTSYDYDAPVTEAGWQGAKYQPLRKLLVEARVPLAPAGEPPAPNPVIAFASTHYKQTASLWENLPPAIHDKTPHFMESYNQGAGDIVYRTHIPADAEGMLSMHALQDFAWLFLDEAQVGEIYDPRQGLNGNAPEFFLPAKDAPRRLDILVEAMGRPNFLKPGTEFRKGANGPCHLQTKDGSKEIVDWDVFCLPFDANQFSTLKFFDSSSALSGPGYYRWQIYLDTLGDTFLDMRGFGKGIAWINGHCLGRYWNIGPQQTLYCPASWLKAGDNEFVLFEHLTVTSGYVRGLTTPILDELHPELDFHRVSPPPTQITY